VGLLFAWAARSLSPIRVYLDIGLQTLVTSSRAELLKLFKRGLTMFDLEEPDGHLIMLGLQLLLAITAVCSSAYLGIKLLYILDMVYDVVIVCLIRCWWYCGVRLSLCQRCINVKIIYCAELPYHFGGLQRLPS